MSNEELIAKLIGQLSPEQQKEVLNSLTKINNVESNPAPENSQPAEKKKKVRRKQYKRASQDFGTFNPKSTQKMTSSSQNLEIGKKKNLFEEMPEFTAKQEDSEVDKKLWANKQPSERSRAYKEVSARCLRCNNTVKVNPVKAHKDTETGEIVFTCDRCLSGLSRRGS